MVRSRTDAFGHGELRHERDDAHDTRVPRNVVQQYGDAVILYTRFRLVLTDRDGAPHEITGRGTEVFVRRDGRWIHSGWHRDQISN